MQRNRKKATRRKGSTLVWVSVSLVVLFGFSALAIDMSHLYMTRAQLQVAATAAATAGASALPNEVDALSESIHYAELNMPVGKHGQVLAGGDVQLGNWNFETREFRQNQSPMNAVRATTRRSTANANPVPLMLAPVLGHRQRDLFAEAIAARGSRDIVLVLDCSTSMNNDSQIDSIPFLGLEAIEDNLREIYQELESPTYGNLTFQPRFIGSTDINQVRQQLGLDGVPYPYPGGSWNEFIYYVMNDDDLNGVGYNNRYGYMTLIDYWFNERPENSQTPGLWRTSAQPITAVKDAVTLFLAYVALEDNGDRVGLSVYTHPNNGAILESGLTTDLAQIANITRERQAGHYMYFTNIGAGLETARVELENNGRDRALKMIVLLTDGKANRPFGNASQFVLDQAYACADQDFPVLTISLGASADTTLMQQVADITNGIHFVIPGGQPVADYEDALNQVFSLIAQRRPTVLVY